MKMAKYNCIHSEACIRLRGLALGITGGKLIELYCSKCDCYLPQEAYTDMYTYQNLDDYARLWVEYVQDSKLGYPAHPPLGLENQIGVVLAEAKTRWDEKNSRK